MPDSGDAEEVLTSLQEPSLTTDLSPLGCVVVSQSGSQFGKSLLASGLDGRLELTL